MMLMYIRIMLWLPSRERFFGFCLMCVLVLGFVCERRKNRSNEEQQEDFIELVKKTKTPVAAVGKGTTPSEKKKFPSKPVPLEFDAAKASVVDYRNIIAANSKKMAVAAASSNLKQRQGRMVGGIAEFDSDIKSLSAVAADAAPIPASDSGDVNLVLLMKQLIRMKEGTSDQGKGARPPPTTTRRHLRPIPPSHHQATQSGEACGLSPSPISSSIHKLLVPRADGSAVLGLEDCAPAR